MSRLRSVRCELARNRIGDARVVNSGYPDAYVCECLCGHLQLPVPGSNVVALTEKARLILKVVSLTLDERVYNI